MTRPRMALLGAAAVMLIATGCSGSSDDNNDSAGTGGPAVQLKLLQFTPVDLTVKAGTAVTWRNAEPITHTVTSGEVTGVDESTGLRAGQSTDGRFDHELTGKGQSFTYTFTEPGTYSYYCSIHKGMNATVVVTA
jgi:plastocyanin